MDVLESSLADAAICRLHALAPLDTAALRALRQAAERPQTMSTNRELIVEGKAITRPYIVARGWAARVRIFKDGRRQILSLLLPGEIFGHCTHSDPCAVSTIVALTDVTVLPAPPTAASDALREAYAVSAAREEAHLLAQIARLGRLSAHERIADLLLELFERLQLAGLTSGNSFDLPLTQEKLADLLGLTSVHVNRMLKVAREANEIIVKSGRVTLLDPVTLARSVGHTNTRVTAR